MTPAQSARPARRGLTRLFDALVDPATAERTMALLLVGYWAAWTLYAVIAKGSQDLNFDMGEVYAWSHEVTLGTPKHPPLAAWLVRAWFLVFPRAVWAYYLFAVMLPTLALWIAWRVSARYLAPDKRVVGIVLLSTVPFYNLLALKFNANSVLTPFWAATAWLFLRSLETRRPGWAVAAGAAAAAAMLGKYWSIFLLGGLAAAALSDRRRGAYFASTAPWLTIAVGAVLLAPHLGWLADHDFGPFRYALDKHAVPLAAAVKSTAGFLLGTLAYNAPLLAGVFLGARPGLPAIRDTLWPGDPDRRTIVVAFAAPLLLAMLAAMVLRDSIVSLWSMSTLTLFPCVLLSSPRVRISRPAAVRLLALAVAFPLGALAMSPAVALVIHHRGVVAYATHYRLIADAIEDAWRKRTAAPLQIVGSNTAVTNGVSFYLQGRPRTLDIVTPDQTPWVNEDSIKRAGAALVCPVPETSCLQAMEPYAARYPAATTSEVTLARRYFGTLDRPVRYRILIVPPP